MQNIASGDLVVCIGNWHDNSELVIGCVYHVEYVSYDSTPRGEDIWEVYLTGLVCDGAYPVECFQLINK